MKELLKRLFNHEELSREEACQLLQDITAGRVVIKLQCLAISFHNLLFRYLPLYIES